METFECPLALLAKTDALIKLFLNYSMSHEAMGVLFWLHFMLSLNFTRKQTLHEFASWPRNVFLIQDSSLSGNSRPPSVLHQGIYASQISREIISCIKRKRLEVLHNAEALSLTNGQNRKSKKHRKK